MPLTGEQQAVVDVRLRPSEVFCINAYAGSGKTTTIEAYARAHSDQKFLYLVFNRSMAEEAGRRLPANVHCKTTHSLAYESLPAGKRRPGEIRPDAASRLLGLPSVVWGAFAVKTLDRFCRSTDRLIGLNHTVSFEDSDDATRDRIMRAARLLWATMWSDSSAVPVPHDAYLKRWCLNGGRLDQYDAVLLDEAQDSNPAVWQTLSERAGRGEFAILAAGDTHQSIYGWRGAVNAMEEAAAGAGRVMTLTSCFRFGQDRADDASTLIAGLKGDTTRIIGAGGAAPEDGTLCHLGRGNRTLIRAASGGTGPVSFEGASDPEEWHAAYQIGEILDVAAILDGRPAESGSAVARYFSDPEHLEQYVRGAAASGAADPRLVTSYRIAKEWGQDAPRIVEDLDRRIRPQGPGVAHFCSAHRSKGREWDSVVMLNDFPDIFTPSPSLASDPQVLVEEINLQYVAMTRARKHCAYPKRLGLWLAHQRGQDRDKAAWWNRDQAGAAAPSSNWSMDLGTGVGAGPAPSSPSSASGTGWWEAAS